MTQQEFRDAIAAAIAARSMAKPRQVSDDLGIVTREGKQLIATTMNNMVKQGWLSRDEGGFYSVSEERYARRLSWGTESQIIETIRRYGGIATWAEIMDEFDTLPSKNQHLPYNGRGGGSQGHISKIMARSKKILRYEHGSKAMWGLPWDELLQLPLSGRAVEWLALWHYLETDAPSGRVSSADEREVREAIEDHFQRVGTAFVTARAFFGEDPEDVVADPTFRNVLLEILRRAPVISRKVSDEVRRGALHQARQEGKADDYAYVERLIENDEEKQKLMTTLVLFEQGYVPLHRIAHASLYVAFASRHNLCPASLSRGLVIRRPVPVTVAEDWLNMSAKLAPVEPTKEMSEMRRRRFGSG